ncbi:N-acetyltransferase [archaeon]|nr:MAG: N-acetyltransferase [archaeon]
MKLKEICIDDLDLYKAMFCDPVHMADLGGPQPEEKVPGILERQVNALVSGKGWIYKIVPEIEDWNGSNIPRSNIDWTRGVGTICIWSGEYKDQPATEIGWGVLPAYQHRGFATKALTALLDLARNDGRWGVVHAFTSVSNESSNKLAKSVGFHWVEECDIDYDGRDLHCNHYVYNT